MPNVNLAAEQNRLIVNFADFSTLLKTFEPLGSPAKRGAFLSGFQETIRGLGLEVEVRVQGRTLDLFGMPAGQIGVLRRLLH